MKLFHRTSRGAAKEILSHGFRDGALLIDTDEGPVGGVWLSSVPFDQASLGREKGEVLLALTIPESELLAWEWIIEGSEHRLPDALREFTVPSETVNRYGPPTVVQE